MGSNHGLSVHYGLFLSFSPVPAFRGRFFLSLYPLTTMGTTPSDLSDTEKLQRLRALDMAGDTQSAADYLLTLDVATLERLHALALLDPSTEMAAPVISLARLMVMMESAV